MDYQLVIQVSVFIDAQFVIKCGMNVDGIYYKIYQHQNKSCFYCNEEIEFILMKKEHVFPKIEKKRYFLILYTKKKKTLLKLNNIQEYEKLQKYNDDELTPLEPIVTKQQD